METFKSLIYPLSVADFYADYWEKTSLHLQHDPNFFGDLFSLRDVDRWLASSHGHLSVTPPQEGRGRAESFRVKEISTSVAYSAFANGSSLVLEPMEEWPGLLTLIQGLSRDFHASIEAKAFLIPEGAEPFPVHVAGYDVIILHLLGKKLWHLHESRLLQLNPTQKKTFKFPLTWYERTKTPLRDKLWLEPGGFLFVPRGMPYQAVDQEGLNLYLKINITPLFWMDFLKIAVENAALHTEELRRALPPGFMDDERVCGQMRSHFESAMAAFREKTSFDEVIAAVKRNRITAQRFPADGHFAHLTELDKLSADTELERRQNVLCAVDEIVDINKNPRSAIFFGNEQVVGPPQLRRALEYICNHPRFRISEIPGLDQESQLVLARRLVREGLLRPVSPSRS